MLRGFLLTLAIVIWSVNGWARDFSYQADVEGMVCAFCAYNVSKKISSLPGVDAESVNVDLENGEVEFRSGQQVSGETLDALFTESGFRLTGLNETGLPVSSSQDAEKFALVLDMRLDTLNTDQFEAVFEALGNIAAASRSRLVIEAPGSLESNLLKPVLMGRKQVMKVRFTPTDTGSIHLQLFQH